MHFGRRRSRRGDDRRGNGPVDPQFLSQGQSRVPAGNQFSRTCPAFVRGRRIGSDDCVSSRAKSYPSCFLPRWMSSSREDVIVANSYVYNHYHDGKEANYFLSTDRINAVAVLPPNKAILFLLFFYLFCLITFSFILSMQ